jgi:hypothetical protein
MPQGHRPAGRSFSRGGFESSLTLTFTSWNHMLWSDQPGLWKLPDLWTRKACADRSLENDRTVFHSFHRRLQSEGDISNE